MSHALVKGEMLVQWGNWRWLKKLSRSLCVCLGSHGPPTPLVWPVPSCSRDGKSEHLKSSVSLGDVWIWDKGKKRKRQWVFKGTAFKRHG